MGFPWRDIDNRTQTQPLLGQSSWRSTCTCIHEEILFNIYSHISLFFCVCTWRRRYNSSPCCLFFPTFYYHSNLNANSNRPFFFSWKMLLAQCANKNHDFFFLSLSFSSFSTNCCSASPLARVTAGLLSRSTHCKGVRGFDGERGRGGRRCC